MTASDAGAGPVVLLHGELDFAHSLDVVQMVGGLIRGGASAITVDVTGLTFVDSSGMAAFVRAHLHAKATGVRLEIIGARGPVRRALEVSGLRDILGVRTGGNDGPVV